VVSVLAIGLMVRGFKPVRGRWILKDDKIHSKPSFGAEVKPLAHVVRFCGLLKNPSKYEILHKAKLVIFLVSSSCFAARWLLIGFPETSGG
jgi:hypothetical protein